MNAELDRRLPANRNLPARDKAQRARDRKLAALGIVADRQPAVEALPTTAAGWYAYAHKHGCTKLGQGASRKTYALDADRVIKIDYAMLNQGGWQGQCNSEAARWQNASEEIRPFLAPVLESGDGWVIMARAKTVISTFGPEVSRTISHDLGTTTGIGDLHGGNIGYFGNGIFKIIDYAL